MSLKQEHSTDDILDRATTQLRNESSLPGPTDELISSTVAALASQISNSPEVLHHDTKAERKHRMLRIFRYSSLAATIMLIAGSIVFIALSNHNTAIAFEQVVEKIKKATSVTYDSTLDNSDNWHSEEKSYLLGDLQRSEVKSKEIKLKNGKIEPPTDIVKIMNYKTKETLEINNREKTAKKSKLAVYIHDMYGKNPLEVILSVTTEHAELEGEEKLNGKKTQRFRLTQIGKLKIEDENSAKVWIDPETGYLVQSILEFHNKESKLKTTIKYDNFQWNVPLKDELFKLDPPKDYKFTEDKTSSTEPNILFFSQVVKNVKKATSVTFSYQQRFGKEPAIEQKYFISGDSQRVESKDQTGISDHKAKEMLNINHVAKTAVKSKYELEVEAVNPLHSFSTITEKDAELIGEEKLNGKSTQLYRLLKLGSDQATGQVWIDPASGLPVRMKLEFTMPPDNQKLTGVFEDFQWNVPLKPELFKLEAPEGYKVTQGAPIKLVRAIPTFDDVIESVKKIKSATFTTKETIGDKPAEEYIYFLHGDLMRKESKSRIIIANCKLMEQIGLDLKEKIAMKGKLFAGQNPQTPLEQITTLISKGAELIGEEKIEGERALVYQTKTPGVKEPTGKAWIDPKSNLPVKLTQELEVQFQPDKKEKVSIVAENFIWNKPLDQKLFNLDPPAGYTVKKIEK